MNSTFPFKCPHCQRQIDQIIDQYYRKKYNKIIHRLQNKIEEDKKLIIKLYQQR